MSRTTRIMLAGIAATLTILVVSVGLVYASIMNGGLDNLFARDRPQESDPEVVAARGEASETVVAEGTALAAQVGSLLGGSSQHLAWGEVSEPCRVGQHNWKINDSFDLSCTLDRLEVVSVPDQRTFRAQMMALDASLRSDGWLAQYQGIDWVMSDYWDRRDSFGSNYSVHNLPMVTYERGYGDTRRLLKVGWADASADPWRIAFEEYATISGGNGGPMTAADVVAGIPVHGYAVVLTESFDYFVG